MPSFPTFTYSRNGNVAFTKKSLHLPFLFLFPFSGKTSKVRNKKKKKEGGWQRQNSTDTASYIEASESPLHKSARKYIKKLGEAKELPNAWRVLCLASEKGVIKHSAPAGTATAAFRLCVPTAPQNPEENASATVA